MTEHTNPPQGGYPPHPGQPAQPPYGQPAPADQQQYGQPYGSPQPPAAGQGYPQPGQQFPPPPYGGPGYAQMRPARPGSVTGAAVLHFVQAALVILGSVFAFAGGSMINDLGNRYKSSSASGIAVFIIILGIVGLICGAALVAGGVKLFSRQSTVALAAGGSSLVLSVAWFAWAMSNGAPFGTAIIWPLLFAIMPCIALGLLMSSTAKAWVAGQR